MKYCITVDQMNRRDIPHAIASLIAEIRQGRVYSNDREEGFLVPAGRLFGKATGRRRPGCQSAHAYAAYRRSCSLVVWP